MTRTFEIHSQGEETLSLTGTPKIKVRGRDAAEFTVTTEPALHIPAGESSALRITFSPTRSGLRLAEIVIESTDEQAHEFTFGIQGIGDITPPALTLSTPAAGALSGLSPIHVSGTVTDDTAVERVELALDDEPPFMAELSPATSSRTNAFQAVLNPGNGPHTLHVTVFDTSGNSRSHSRVFSFVRQWRLGLHREVPPTAFVNPDLAGSLLLTADARRSTPRVKGEPQTASAQPGTEVQVSATAKTGYLFDHWSGLPEGAEIHGSVVRWTMPEADVNDVTATFIANPFLTSSDTPVFPGSGGTVVFSGLAEPVSPTVWSNANVGHLSAVLSLTTGSITGTLRMDGGVHAFNARCLGDGSIWFRGTTGLHRRTWVAGQRSLTLNWSQQGIALSVSGPASSLSEGLAAPAVNPPPALLNPRGLPVLYTLIFPSQAQAPLLSADKYPQGTGYATGTLSTQGSWPLTIILADDTKTTASPILTRGNTAVLFAMLTAPGTRQPGGSFLGTLVFDATQNDSDVSAMNLHWFRQAVTESSDTSTHPYTDGWPQGLEMPAIGAKYDVSLTIQQALALPSPDDTRGNVTLTFSGGGILNSPMLNLLGISTSRILKSPPVTSGLALSFSTGQALFKGRFSPDWSMPAKTSPEFQGVLIQKGLHRGGHGFFLSNREKDTDPQSGRVLFQP